MKTLSTLLLTLGLFLGTALFGNTIDAKKSALKWRGEKVTGHHEGNIAIKSGFLDLSKKKGEFVVDMTSIVVTDLSGGAKTKLTNHLKSADFFAVSSHKTAKLVIKSIAPDGKNKNKFKAKGDLTIKGITKPVSFEFDATKAGYKGNLVFDRTLYDIKYKSGSFFKNLGDKLIYDKVKLDFNLVPKKS